MTISINKLYYVYYIIVNRYVPISSSKTVNILITFGYRLCIEC